jgi:hypothetical protein
MNLALDSKSRAEQFVDLVAGAHWDGEKDDDGGVFEVENDDMYDWMIETITLARKFQKDLAFHQLLVRGSTQRHT